MAAKAAACLYQAVKHMEGDVDMLTPKIARVRYLFFLRFFSTAYYSLCCDYIEPVKADSFFYIMAKIIPQRITISAKLVGLLVNTF